MSISEQLIWAGWQLVEADLTDGTSGNISTRCPDGVTALITPSARDYRLLTERDLIRVHLETERAEGRWKPSSEWRLHVEIYRTRPDINAIVHHHGTWASAVAVAHKTIPVLIGEASDIGPIPTAAYAPSGSRELAESASRELVEGTNAILLANHGVVAVGRDLREAMRRALEVERLAKIYIGAEVLGGVRPLDQAEVLRSQKALETYRATSMAGSELIPCLPRIIGPVGIRDLLNYSFRAGLTFGSLVHTFVLQKFHK